MGTQYQSFPDARGASYSVDKLKSLMLPELRGKSFLDVGCNEGFFCAIARGAGASRVLGIDADAEMLQRARQRFSGIEFRHQSWDDPIEGRFDTVLFSSAIHYAKNQPALIEKLVGLLTPDGVLVLELGIAEQAGDQYVPVKRTSGGVCFFATPDALRRVLAAFDVREAGPSVAQRGDPVPRHVLHIRRRPPASPSVGTPPAIVLFDAPSRSAKSSTVGLIQRYAPRERVRQVAIDGLLIRVSEDGYAPQPAHAAVHREIVRFRREQSTRTDLALDALLERGMFEEFLALIESAAGAGAVPVTLWDGYLPPAAREITRLYFERRGYQVWNACPRQRFRAMPIDTAQLAETAQPAEAGVVADADPGVDAAAALARLESLKLPQVQGKSLLVLGPWADTVCELARRGGAASAVTQDPGGPDVGRFDVIVYRAGAEPLEGTIARIREFLHRLSPDGLLAVEFPPADRAESALASPSKPGREGERDLAPLLRRELPDFVVRKVKRDTIAAAAGPVAQMVHIRHARPVLLLVEDRAHSDDPALLRSLFDADAGAGFATMPVTELLAQLERGAPMPDAELVCSGGALPVERRDGLLQALVAAGFVVWEIRERATVPFTALDVAAALAATFPDATPGVREQAAPAPGGKPAAPPGARQRLRKLARSLARRLGVTKRPASAAATPTSPATAVSAATASAASAKRAAAAASAPPAAAPAPTTGRKLVAREARVHKRADGVDGLLQEICITRSSIELRGWAVDVAARRAIPEFVVELDGVPVTGFRLARARRPAIRTRFGLARQDHPGFVLEIAVPDTAPLRSNRFRVGCRAQAGGEVHWLRRARDFRMDVAPQAASGVDG